MQFTVKLHLLANGTQLGGLQGDVQKGINVIEQDFKWHGTATRADALIDATGATRLAAQFLPVDTNGTPFPVL